MGEGTGVHCLLVETDAVIAVDGDEQTVGGRLAQGSDLRAVLGGAEFGEDRAVQDRVTVGELGVGFEQAVAEGGPGGVAVFGIGQDGAPFGDLGVALGH